MLRLLTQKVGVGIGKNKDAVIAIDGAELAARISRQARVAGRVEVAGTHELP